MNADAKLQRSCAFMRSLRGFMRSGAFGGVKVIAATVPDNVKEAYADLLSETDKSAEAWRVRAFPRVANQEPDRSVKVGSAWADMVLARVEMQDFEDVVVTESGSTLAFESGRFRSGRFERNDKAVKQSIDDLKEFARAAEKRLLRFTITRPVTWTVVAIPRRQK